MPLLGFVKASSIIFRISFLTLRRIKTCKQPHYTSRFHTARGLPNSSATNIHVHTRQKIHKLQVERRCRMSIPYAIRKAVNVWSIEAKTSCPGLPSPASPSRTLLSRSAPLALVVWKVVEGPHPKKLLLLAHSKIYFDKNFNHHQFWKKLTIQRLDIHSDIQVLLSKIKSHKNNENITETYQQNLGVNTVMTAAVLQLVRKIERRNLISWRSNSNSEPVCRLWIGFE